MSIVRIQIISDSDYTQHIMGKISQHVIRVKDAASLSAWYKSVMGMNVTQDQDSGSWTASYPGPGVQLLFQVCY